MRNKQYIEKNRTEFNHRIKQLKHILDDVNYLHQDSTYREFIGSMYHAINTGRKITSLMESSITKIVKSYKTWLNTINDTSYLENKTILLNKITMVRTMLERAPYTSNFKYEKEIFIDSLYNQARNRGSLSPKQKSALNKMYKQYKKKVENI
ncbi:hypothetical protein HOE22_10900 [Candidatus Woesearchaeota archaeon]|jgi:hypothetical protein|nr:hypothetical protein [Candidatus Woesearchaeota archaeon]MBT4732579.1 hypothetical protein [Candidatus Woesearchaeota archaeon]MBT7558771.1 hypothetical protein [Candidatus Woesearchaeota archaeon]